jgi:RND family efflux transporter MFP subunit
LALSALFATSSGAVLAEELSGFDCLIEPNSLTRVSTRELGIIESVEVERGDAVSKGQVLIVLESSVEIIAVELARARAEMRGTVESRRTAVAYRRRQSERVRKLHERKAASFTEHDQAMTDLLLAERELQDVTETMKLAEIELRRAEQALERRTIRSPVDGVIVQLLLLPGESVKDVPIIAVAAIDPLHVEVILPVRVMNRVKKGMHAEVLAQVPGATPRQATITVVDRLVDAASNTFGVGLELPNEDYGLPGGIRCDIRFLADN